jgi:hypothetical protein
MGEFAAKSAAFAANFRFLRLPWQASSKLSILVAVL